LSLKKQSNRGMDEADGMDEVDDTDDKNDGCPIVSSNLRVHVHPLITPIGRGRATPPARYPLRLAGVLDKTRQDGGKDAA